MTVETIIWMIIVLVGHIGLFGFTINAALKEAKSE